MRPKVMIKANVRSAAFLIAFAAICSGQSAPVGVAHPAWPHVISAGSGWTPEPGYRWVYLDSVSDLSVRWTPGDGYYYAPVKWPHIVASNTEGRWTPEPGYAWSHLDSRGYLTDYAVHWQAGIPYRKLGELTWPHIVSADTEGEWYPAPGYTWIDSLVNLAVHWTPGQSYKEAGAVRFPHIHAADAEGSWSLEPGYEWAHLDANGNLTDFTVIPETGEHRAARSQWRALNDRWAKYLREIQDAHAYANWSGPPHDLYVASRTKE